MPFNKKYNVEKLNNPKKSGGNVYPYKVINKKNGNISYLSDKGLNAVKNQNKEWENDFLPD